jgi:5'-phosphate synthase pdxT subunit
VSQSKPKIGVLALQGDFERHRRAIERAGGEAAEVRTAPELESCQGLVIPGGESTTMLKLLREEGLVDVLRRFAQEKPVFGTCAGAILLASEVTHPAQESLGLVDITVERNAYGRQIDSRIAQIDFEGQPAEAVFIRAPVIRRTGPQVKTLATYLGNPVLVEQGLHVVATFHPELTENSRFHKRLIEKISERKL